MKKSILFMLIVFFSCSKNEETPTPVTPTPTPTPVPTLGCRLDFEDISGDFFSSRKIDYDKDGFINSFNYTLEKDKQSNYNVKCFYENGLLIGINDSGEFIEKYDYTKGALSKITLTKSLTKADLNYTIDLETDAEKRIVKMTDSKGFQSDLKRDAKGNLIELKTTRIEDKKEIFRMVQSDFDNKKTIYEFFKGWQFDVRMDYLTYMNTALFTVGASGNAKKGQIYKEGLIYADLEYTFDYSLDGYPIRSESLDKINNRKTMISYTLKDCK